MRRVFRKIFNYHDTESADIREFLSHFDHLQNSVPTHVTQRKLGERITCMQEELDEFREAVKSQDLALQADALIDLVYFAKGTAIMLGLPWEELWSDVHRANMDKVPGVTKRGHAKDCVKPMDWKAPQTMRILKNNGYNRRRFINHSATKVEESLCDDDR